MFSSLVGKSKKLFKNSKKFIEEKTVSAVEYSTKKISKKYQEYKDKHPEKISNEEALIRLNLIHENTSMFPEFEKDSFRYFFPKNSSEG